MKIGIDARLYHETGVGRYIYNLLREFSKIDNGNEYIVFTTKKASFEIKDFKNMTVVPVSVRWHSLKEQVVFPLILNHHRLDLIHFPYFSVPILNTHPFAVTIHDLTTLEFKTGRASTLPYYLYNLKHLAYKLILKNALYNSKKIIVPSKTVKEEIVKHFKDIDNKISVTYEAGAFLGNGFKETLSYEPFFLYVGNVYPHKNIENAVKAVSHLNSQTNKKYTFVIVSKKDHFRDLLQKFITKNNYSAFVKFKDNISDSELSYLYKRAEALLFPSFKEGFGLPVLEALNNKCLVCCSDIKVFKELYKDIPFYFNPDKDAEIAMALHKIILMKDTEKNKIREMGLKLSSQFTWEKTARQTLRVYQEAVT